MTRSARPLSVALILTVLTACGSAGAGIRSAPPSKPQSEGMGYVKATLFVPPARGQSAAQIAYLRSRQAMRPLLKGRPQYLSGNTTELDFVLNSNNGAAASASDQAAFNFTIYTSDSSECSGTAAAGYTCSVTAPAPVGSDTYKIYSYQCSASGSGASSSCTSLGGKLTLLGMSFATVNVIYDQIVVAAFTLSPVIASIDWAPVTYAKENSTTNMLPSQLWLTQPNGAAIPKYNPTPTPGSYSCAVSTGSGSGNGCYEPVAQGVSLAYGEVLEARDATGALIVGASGGGTVYQTPVYLDQSGSAVTISWSCKDSVIGGRSLTWETGGGPYTNNSGAPHANQYFNSPVANPSGDPDGGNTTDGNGNPVTAVGNNGMEMNWDGVDQPVLDTPDSCTASTSDGLTTSPLNFYVGLGEGGVTFNPTPSPAPTPDATVYEGANSTDAQSTPEVEEFGQGAFGQGAAAIIGGLPTYPPTSNCPNANCEVVTALAFDSGGNLWAHVDLNDDQAQVSSYLVEYSGAPSAGAIPLRIVSIPEGGTSGASDHGLAIDGSGNAYVSSGGVNSVREFSIGSGGTAALVKTISGPRTQLLSPGKLTLDSSGNLWVLNSAQGPQPQLLEFAPGASGNAAPSKSLMSLPWLTNCQVPLAGPAVAGAVASRSRKPGLLFVNGSIAWGMAFDPAGNLFVGLTTNNSTAFASYVLELAAGFTSTTCPSHMFNPTNAAGGLAVDDKGFLYIGEDTVADVGVYSEDSVDGPSGLAAPFGTYLSPAGASGFPDGLAVYTSSGWHSGN